MTIRGCKDMLLSSDDSVFVRGQCTWSCLNLRIRTKFWTVHSICPVVPFIGGTFQMRLFSRLNLNIACTLNLIIDFLICVWNNLDLRLRLNGPWSSADVWLHLEEEEEVKTT
eukprot:5337607-Amphidinium_carterae.1